MESGWVVLKSQPRREPLALHAVTARGVRSYLPRLPVQDSRRQAAPLFPGYLFAQASPGSDDLLRIRSAPGIAYVLPRAGTPALLPGQLIEAIRSREEQLTSNPPDERFAHGERVQVVAGPFKWVHGIFDRSMTPAGRVRILLSLVHGSIAVQMEAADLTSLAAARRGVALAS